MGDAEHSSETIIEPLLISVSRTIAAPSEAIFEVLADPSRHHEIDGSNMVGHARGASQQLTLGSKFGMDMKLGPLPYRMTNEVVEFEPNRLIAWRHLGHHVWRFTLEPGESGTRVTETWDLRPARMKWAIKAAGYHKRHPDNIARTLDRLAALVEAP